MICLSKIEFEELRYWLEKHYDGCPINEQLASQFDTLGDRQVPGLVDLILEFKGQYCDDVAPQIYKRISVID